MFKKIKLLYLYLFYKKKFGNLGSRVRILGKIHTTNPKAIHIGSKCQIGHYCRIESFSNYGKQELSPKLIIKENTCIEHAVHMYCANSLFIGRGVLIASGCMITDNNHGINPEKENYVQQPLMFKETKISDGVWLGENVSVLPGSHIGEKTIIGANSVVSGSIPPYCIAVGNPAKVIKKYNFQIKSWEKIND